MTAAVTPAFLALIAAAMPSRLSLLLVMSIVTGVPVPAAKPVIALPSFE